MYTSACRVVRCALEFVKAKLQITSTIKRRRMAPSLLHLTFAGSRARSQSRIAARHLTDSEVKRILHRLSAATEAVELRNALSEAKPLVTSLALQIPSLKPMSSPELVQDLCRLTLAMTAAQERLEGRNDSEVLQGRRLADDSGGCHEADQATIAPAVARTTDFLARLDQCDEPVRTEARPAKRAGIAWTGSPPQPIPLCSC